MRSRILVVGRDIALRGRLGRTLNAAGYGVEFAEGAAQARQMGRKDIALAIVAAESTGPTPEHLIQELRSTVGKTLVVSTSPSRRARCDALDPADEAELLARIAEATNPAPDAELETAVLEFAGYRLDLAGHSLSTESGSEVPLTRGEFRLLQAFLQHPGRALTRDYLLQILAGRDAEAFDRSIDMLVVRLRRKVEPNPRRPRLIVTVAGVGYKFTARVRNAEVIAVPESTAAQPASTPTAAVPSVPERRHVTVLAAELVGPLPHDPEELRTLFAVYRNKVDAAITRYGGSVVQCHMRESLARFGYPVALEYAAERAIHAAFALAEELADSNSILPPGLAIRTGVASGLVVADPAGEVVGEAPGLAIRLCDLAAPGQVFVCDRTRRLAGTLFAFHDVGRRAVTGLTDLVQGWQVLEPSTLTSHSEALYADLQLPLVGRDDELDLLLRAWRQVASGRGRVVLLSGEPGVGKSRLLAGLEEALADVPHTSLRYFCSPLYTDIALHPIVTRWRQEADFTRADSADMRLRKLEAILAPVDLPSEDIALIAALLAVPTGERYSVPDLSPQRRKERTYAALHRRLFSRTRAGPLLMLFEDVHWADSSSLELFDGVVEQLADLPILLVISFRPDFTPPWIGRAGSTLITLSRLDHRHSAELATRVAGRQRLAPAVLDHIIAQAEGIPLFIEELTRAAIDATDGPVAAARQDAVPGSSQALLMARLDRLPAAKQVAQIGAVIGREFPHALLAAVARLPEAQLQRGLDDLLNSGLASRRGAPPDTVYAFKHALVQNAVYESLLKSRRAEIHAAIVAAAEADSCLALEPAVLAHHCAQAGLIAEAAAWYRVAGMRSAEQFAAIETRTQLERGLRFAATLPDGTTRHRLEAELLVARGGILLRTQGNADVEAGAAFTRAAELCDRLDSPETLARALWGRFIFASHRGDVTAAHGIGRKLTRLSEEVGEAWIGGLARTVMGIACFWQGHFTEARRQHEKASVLLAQAQETDRDLPAMTDWRPEFLLRAYPALTMACLGYPEQAGHAVRAIHRPGAQVSYVLAQALAVLGRALIVLRDDASLRRWATAHITLCEERGYRLCAASRCALGWLEAREGRARQGLQTLQAAITRQRDLGISLHLPLFLGLEADALACDERWSEALSTVRIALELSGRTGETWFDSELHRRGGELLLKGPPSDTMAAERELLTALDIAHQQLARLFELRAAMSLARMRAARGELSEAHTLLASLYAWFTEGLNTVDLDEARWLLDDLRRSGA